MKALIVDDEIEIGQLVARILTQRGYEPTTASSLADAATTLQAQEYDVVFLDLHLPDGTGFSIIPLIRAQNTEARIVVISAYEGQEEKKATTEYEVDDYLKKPFSKQQILETLNAVA